MEEEMAVQPGIRFYPTEEELISFYLNNKLQQNNRINRVIPLLDIYKLDPWHLPKHCGELCRGDSEQWFFFMPKQEQQLRGGKPSRTTASGYWKATGSLSHVYSLDSKVIGMKKTMVFYKGKAPTGTKTKWKMNEYRSIQPDLQTSIPKLRDEVSLCRIYVVSGSLRAFDRRPLHVAESVQIRKEIRPTVAERSCSSSGTSSFGSQGENGGEVINIDEWLGSLIESEGC